MSADNELRNAVVKAAKLWWERLKVREQEIVDEISELEIEADKLKFNLNEAIGVLNSLGADK